MPGKHVRFAETVFPLTPSPTFSSTSLPSTPDPLTPPPIPPAGSPYGHAPLPKQPVRVHPCLGSSSKPLLRYDISLPPCNITPSEPSLHSSVFHEYATMPPLPHLIICHPSLQWRIVVHARSGTGVTVAEVLHALHEQLRVNSSATEFHALPRATQDIVSDAYNRRYKRIPDPNLREVERAKGLKRVDFFGGRTIFMGLSSTIVGPETWELHTL